ncbi:TIR domain-containing protein [Accumulibacter sp.]|uniref:TIR domain-containing protein n=1 Tax=Accumulibacter sp. TaxID=2053492 RepID=UPI002C01737B|nr:TIR domain-containing protein [Accumulibacter sp.]HNC27683.1 TIR domain-containing protein [Accumulibacter sp.]
MEIPADPGRQHAGTVPDRTQTGERTVSAAQPPRGVRVFVSYAHEDDALRLELHKHLDDLASSGEMVLWDDRQIPPGANWEEEIFSRLGAADMILLLVSADFLASAFCKEETRRAIARRDDAGDPVIVVPVILRDCRWEHLPFARSQVLPPGATPLRNERDKDAYFKAVADALAEEIKRFDQVNKPWVRRIGQRLRDPTGGRHLRFVLALLVLLAVSVGAALWWGKAQMSAGVAALRDGSYAAAHEALAAECQRAWWGSARVCAAAETAKLGMLLEAPPEQLDVEAVGRGVGELRARPGGEQNATLLLFAAQLKLRENDPRRRGAAIAEALRLLEQAIALDPELAEAHYVLADLSLARADYATALSALDKAVASAPDAPHYRNARAYARWQSGDVRGAEADYRQSADGGALLSHLELAELLWRDGRFAAAADQQQAAYAALRDDQVPRRGRNHLPWIFANELAKQAETPPGEASTAEASSGEASKAEAPPGEASKAQTRRLLVLRLVAEKRCYAQLAWQASRWLAGQTPPATVEEAATPANDCGAHRSEIQTTLAGALQRATPPAAQARAAALAAALQAGQ